MKVIDINGRFHLTLVVKVTQNWSLECKMDVCWKCKIGARIGKIGAWFWLSLGAVWFVKNRRPDGGIRGPILHNNIFQKRIFWARFVTILW